jgi:hypothetical protein
MKTKLLFLSAIFTFCSTKIQAQNRTQINALNSEISANLDLKAVASVFGESENLEDFESRLNDPKLQLSNLDLNYDNQVDYLRVVESIENQNHIILIQAVINRDLYQDIATIDVDKDYYNNVTIQIIGNTNLYGANYIFEPTYNSRPRLLSLFWNANYRLYYSNWRWNYYPKHYYSWSPYSSYKYRRNIEFNINHNASFNRVNYRRSSQAESKYNSRYNNQRPVYSYSNRDKHEINRRGSIENNEKREANESNRNNDKNYRIGDQTQRSNTRREIPQNKTLEIKEVEIQRHRNQYVTLPTIREKERGSRENNRRE